MADFIRYTELGKTVLFEKMFYNEALSRGYDGTSPVMMTLHWTANVSSFPSNAKTIYAFGSPPPGLDDDVIFLDMNSSSPNYKKLLYYKGSSYSVHFPEMAQYFGEYEAFVNGGGFNNPDSP